MTNVSPLAHEIVEKECGINCPYDQKVFIKKVVGFFQNEQLQKKYRKNALQFAKKYDWEHIFNRCFQSI
jgi:hypothetical protein